MKGELIDLDATFATSLLLKLTEENLEISCWVEVEWADWIMRYQGQGIVSASVKVYLDQVCSSPVFLSAYFCSGLTLGQGRS